MLPPQIILDKVNEVKSDNFVLFKNPLTKQNEPRILDPKTGVFVKFPRLQTVALYHNNTLLFET